MQVCERTCRNVREKTREREIKKGRRNRWALGATKMRCQIVVNNIINVGDKMELVVVASNAAQEMDAVRCVCMCYINPKKEKRR